MTDPNVGYNHHTTEPPNRKMVPRVNTLDRNGEPIVNNNININSISINNYYRNEASQLGI